MIPPRSQLNPTSATHKQSLTLPVPLLSRRRVQQELIFKEKRGPLPSSTAHLHGVLNVERGISQGQSPRVQGPTPSSPWASGALAVADSVHCSLGKGKSPTSEQLPLHGGGKPCALTGRRRSGL